MSIVWSLIKKLNQIKFTSWYSDSQGCVPSVIFIPRCAEVLRARTRKRVTRLRSPYLPHAAMATSNAYRDAANAMSITSGVFRPRKRDVLNSNAVTLLKRTVSQRTLHCIVLRKGNGKQHRCITGTDFRVLISGGKLQPVELTFHF